MTDALKLNRALSGGPRAARPAHGWGVIAERFCEFTRLATQINLDREPGPQMALLVRSVFKLRAVALLDADLHRVYQAGDWSTNPDLENQLWNIHFFEAVSDVPDTGVRQRVLRIGNLPIGAMLLRGPISRVASSAIAHIVSINLDRFHSHANVSRTESGRRAEQLRTTVLDSLAHAYKSPLTAIMAASSGLGAMGALTPAQARLVTLIDEQAILLNELSTRLLKTAQLDARDLAPRMEMVTVGHLIDEVVADFRAQMACLSIHVARPMDSISICCDRSLLVALLSQYLDNAAKYSTEGSTVTISAEERREDIVFFVHNLGPVIPAADLEQVFDRFFRCSLSAQSAPGTGIGLSVAKRAAQTHGGRVWVTSDSSRGTTFFASLPVTPRAEPAP